MKLWRSLALHGSLLALASSLALHAASKDDAPRELGESEVKVWGGSPKDLESVRFESKKRSVVFTPREDAEGRWYEVHVEREVAPKAPPGGPDEEAESQVERPKAREKDAFVSVSEGEKAATSLAPLIALRSVGRVEEARNAEFGLNEPSGTLKIRISGQDHTLVLGASTPGGEDRYARLAESNEVFAFPGDLVRRFENAEKRLMERELHAFDDSPPTRIKLTRGAQSRELVSASSKSGGWANAASPEKPNETATNWLGKLERLQVKSYAQGDQALAGATPVLTVDYFDAGRAVGRLELLRRGTEAGAAEANTGTPTEAPGVKYFVRTEHTRWPAVVTTATAVELEQEVGALFE
jgi:hypothetical protein